MVWFGFVLIGFVSLGFNWFRFVSLFTGAQTNVIVRNPGLVSHLLTVIIRETSRGFPKMKKFIFSKKHYGIKDNLFVCG